jgi:hypothetical protein
MATARPFAYNTGAGITGTVQFGYLAVGTPTAGFSATGLQWWNGPDEDLGYVIAQSVSGNTQPTPLINPGPSNQMVWGTTYKAVDISLSNANLTATQVISYSQSVLSNTFIQPKQKVMFTVAFDSTQPSVGVGGRTIGIGTTSMNYQGPFNGYPGNDTQSIGFSDDGKFYFAGSVQASGLPTWTSGDVIDIAVDNVAGLIWVRVNGGSWNGNPSNDPATATGSIGITGGLDVKFTYPAVNPYIYGSMTAYSSAPYGSPSGFSVLGINQYASVGFFRSSALTDPSFISIANAVAGPSGGGPFASGSAAKTWLNANGYWTSYVGATGSTGASGAFVVTITQVGPDVVWSGSGGFNLTSLTLVGSTVITSGFQANQAIWIAGATSTAPGVTGQQYGGASLTYPSTFATGSATILSIAATGSMFGVLPGGVSGRTITVPDGYVSGNIISGSTTYSNTTIGPTGLGLSGGTYTWAWGSGANASSLVMTIG